MVGKLPIGEYYLTVGQKICLFTLALPPTNRRDIYFLALRIHTDGRIRTPSTQPTS